MVLERLLNPIEAERQPLEMFCIGLFYSSFSLLLSYWIFRGYTSIVMVSLTVVVSIPIVHNIIKYECTKDEKIDSETRLLVEHMKAISAFTFLFLGFTASFFLWYVFLPGPMIQNIFSAQIDTIRAITTSATGNFINPVGTIGIIFFNNAKILCFCALFSLFYGAGAIFILTWNASVMATAIGSYVRNGIANVAGSSFSQHFHVTSIGLAKYLIHGVPEIIAYFIGGLAGGLISIAIIRYKWGSKNLKRVLWDSFNLLLVALVVLFASAILEVFLSPMIG